MTLAEISPYPGASVYIGTVCKNKHDPCWRYTHNRHCVLCQRDYKKTWTPPDPVATKERAHAGYVDRPFTTLLTGAKKRASRRGVPFDLTVDSLPPVPEYCPVLGIRLERGIGRPQPNSPALDCIVPSLGYVVGNVHWISQRANIIKTDATAEELMKVATYFAELEGANV